MIARTTPSTISAIPSGTGLAGKSLAHDLKDRGIAVAILHPGLVQTRMTNFTSSGITAEQSVQGLLARIAALNLENSGMLWHSNGEVLPW